MLAQVGGQILGDALQLRLLGQRQHRGLDRGEPRVQAQHGTLVHAALGVRGLVHVVGVHQERHKGAGQAGGRLDDVRNEAFAGGLVEVAQVLAGVVLVRGQVEVGAVGDALQLAPLGALETEAVFDVHGTLGVVAQLLLRMLVMAQVLRLDAQIGVPAGAGVDPVLVPFLVGARHHEELHLHLLELAGTEDEVARGDLVAEALAHVRNAERRLGARGGHDVLEVHEDALRGLRAQIVQAVLILHRAQMRAQHHVEVARFGPIALGAAVRAHDVLQAVLRLMAVLLGVGFLELVGAMALVAVQALDQRVVEHGDVSGGHPHGRRQDHRGVHAHHVAAGHDHRAPPFALDVVLERHAERAVVPRGTGAAVDLAGGENESATLREGYHFIEFACSHNAPSGLNGLGSCPKTSGYR